jgi:hypothetical protein
MKITNLLHPNLQPLSVALANVLEELFPVKAPFPALSQLRLFPLLQQRPAQRLLSA